MTDPELAHLWNYVANTQNQVDALRSDLNTALAQLEPSAIASRLDHLQGQLDALAQKVQAVPAWQPEVSRLDANLAELQSAWSTFRRNQ